MVAATGPSLTPKVAEAVRGHRCIAVNDAYKLLPFSDVLYACDGSWWNVHAGCPGFAGEKWSSHGTGYNDKLATAQKYGLQLVSGAEKEGFSLEPSLIYYGSNSGFQAVNLAILFGATRIVLVGFDMSVRSGKRHFFGDHPAPLRNSANYANFIRPFERAAKTLPSHITILNATPGSALRCFPMVKLDDALMSHAA